MSKDQEGEVGKEKEVDANRIKGMQKEKKNRGMSKGQGSRDRDQGCQYFHVIAQLTKSSLNATTSREGTGLGRIPFELYALLLSVEGVESFLSQVMTQALQDARMPRSCQQTCIILSYKGDATELGLASCPS